MLCDLVSPREAVVKFVFRNIFGRLLGKHCVRISPLPRRFVSAKQQIELEKLKSSDPTDDADGKGWEKEKELYKNI